MNIGSTVLTVLAFDCVTVLRYREEKPRQMKLPLVPEDEDVFVPNCRTAYGKRFNAFKKHFSRVC